MLIFAHWSWFRRHQSCQKYHVGPNIPLMAGARYSKLHFFNCPTAHARNGRAFLPVKLDFPRADWTTTVYTPDISWLSDGRRDGRSSYCTLQGRQMIYDSTSHPSCRELSDRGVDGFWCEQIYMTTKKKKKTKKQENKLNEKYEYIFWTFVHYTVYSISAF